MIGSSGRGARNRSIAQTGSLFPFLAVLICTMGTLVFLLVVVSQYAKTDAAQEFLGEVSDVSYETPLSEAEPIAPEAVAMEAESLEPIASEEIAGDSQVPSSSVAAEEETPDAEGSEAVPSESELRDQQAYETAEAALQWRIEALEASRSVAETQLTDTRVRLGEIESQVAIMQDEAAHLQGVLAEMDRRADDSGEGIEDLDQRQLELERLLAEIDLKEEELEKLRAEGGQRPPVYAIIPFTGRNGTRRRPIYLECREDGVFYQPGDIELLAPGEFQISDLPSNTIDRVLRSVRDYWTVQDGADSERGEPYPLLIIRPGGVAAYRIAVESMLSWNGEYGYEPVADGFELQFPVPDVELGRRVASVVDDSRAKHRQALARLAALGTRMSIGEEEAPRATYSASQSPGGGIVHATPDLEMLGEHVMGAPSFGSGPGGPFEETSIDTTSLPSAPLPQSMSPVESGPVAPPWESFMTEPESETGRRSAIFPEGENRESIFDRDEGLPAGPPLGGAGLESGTPGATGAGAPDETQTDDMTIPQWTPAAEQPVNAEQTLNRESLASARGADWAIPGGMRRGTVVRPIRIDLYADRLIVIGEDNYSIVREIRLQGAIRDVVDRFVPTIWEQIEQWGTAGDEREWQPALSVHVMAGGENRFVEFETLLDGSGLLVIEYQQ